MRQPELAKKNPKRIFLSAADGGYFDRVFNADLTAEKFVRANRLALLVDEYVRKFMTRKRRRERVADWRKDYEEVLGENLVEKHADVLDQVIPQSAVFLTAITFEIAAAHGEDIEALAGELEADPKRLNQAVEALIDVAKADPNASRSWPTLLKSQGFFEKVAQSLKGKAGDAS